MHPCGPESTGSYEGLLDLCPGVLFRQRPDFSFQYIGQKILGWSGLPAEDWLRRSDLLQQLVYEGDAASVKRHLAACRQTEGEMHIVFRMRNRQTGRITCVGESRRACRDAAGAIMGYEGLWRDVSTEAFAARALDAATWDATFGLMTVGAAHDLNNKLTGILSLSDLYLSDLDRAHPMREGLGTIKQSAQQASQLLHQLAAVQQASPGHREYMDLNQFTMVAADLLRRIVSSRIVIEAIPHSEPVAVNVERVRLQRLVLTWVMQAVERMPKRGRLRLQTGRMNRDRKVFGGLTITDTGTELVMPPSPPEASGPLIVHEPPEGATVDQLTRLARAHGGTLEVRSRGGNTELEILLPESLVADEPGRPAKPWLLLIGKVSDDLAELARELEVRGLAPVTARDPVDEQLNPNWFQWDAVLIHGTVAGVPQLLAPVRQRRLPVKILVCAAAGDIAELEPWVSSAAELVAPAHWPRERVAEKIAKLLM
jgi:signal transduction histidine kinase